VAKNVEICGFWLILAILVHHSGCFDGRNGLTRQQKGNCVAVASLYVWWGGVVVEGKVLVSLGALTPLVQMNEYRGRKLNISISKWVDLLTS